MGDVGGLEGRFYLMIDQLKSDYYDYRQEKEARAVAAALKRKKFKSLKPRAGSESIFEVYGQ